MTLYEIATKVRQYNGEVWFVQQLPVGILIRFALAGRQLRVGVPRPGSDTPTFPEETNSELHVAQDMPRLVQWLSGFAPTKKGSPTTGYPL